MQILKIRLKNVRFIQDATLSFDHSTCFVGKEPKDTQDLLDACGFMAAVALRQETAWLEREEWQLSDFWFEQDVEAKPEFVVDAQLADKKYALWRCVYDLEKQQRLNETLWISETPNFGEDAMPSQESEDMSLLQNLLGVFAAPEEHTYDIFVDPVKRWPFLSRLTIMVDSMTYEAKEMLLEGMRPFFPGIKRLWVRYWPDEDKSFFYAVDGRRVGERAMTSADRKIMDIIVWLLNEDDPVLLRKVDDCQPEERYPVMAQSIRRAKKQVILTTDNPNFADCLEWAKVNHVFHKEDNSVGVSCPWTTKAEVR